MQEVSNLPAIGAVALYKNGDGGIKEERGGGRIFTCVELLDYITYNRSYNRLYINYSGPST